MTLPRNEHRFRVSITTGLGGASADRSLRRAEAYDRPETLTKAFQGVEKILLFSAVVPGQRLRQHKAVIDAAKAAGVNFVAYTSMLNAIHQPTCLLLSTSLQSSTLPTRASSLLFYATPDIWKIISAWWMRRSNRALLWEVPERDASLQLSLCVSTIVTNVKRVAPVDLCGRAGSPTRAVTKPACLPSEKTVLQRNRDTDGVDFHLDELSACRTNGIFFNWCEQTHARFEAN